MICGIKPGAGLADVHLHDLRRTFATAAGAAGVIVMTMGDQQQFDGLGICARRFDVAEERLVGAAAAGFDERGMASPWTR
jgi:hypothetical protein